MRRLAVDAACPPNPWGPNIVRSYHRRLQSLVAARDYEDLRQVKCLDLKAQNRHDLKGSSIRLVDRARLLLDFDAVKTDEVTVVDIIESDTREVAP
jgi:proteic killer suppression protein